jgi:hypothetical protein
MFKKIYDKYKQLTKSKAQVRQELLDNVNENGMPRALDKKIDDILNILVNSCQDKKECIKEVIDFIITSKNKHGIRHIKEIIREFQDKEGEAQYPYFMETIEYIHSINMGYASVYFDNNLSSKYCILVRDKLKDFDMEIIGNNLEEETIDEI